ncbi:hypothetical protein M5K25_020090 [Dendrobium thyrsiflorum]|uniref:Uncharacterized protein n=1 Tax=Dendrobium thyrsiflorum TaxID=117978 RepID=A0ABD0U901_DENTH
MPRFTNFFGQGKAASAVWIISTVIFYLLFRAVMDNSTSTNTGNHTIFLPFFSPASTAGLQSLRSDTESLMSSSEKRSRLYDEMSRDIDEHGMKFLQGGETSQSLMLNDIFELRGGYVIPKPKAADPPVRANVLYLSPEFSNPISFEDGFNYGFNGMTLKGTTQSLVSYDRLNCPLASKKKRGEMQDAHRRGGDVRWLCSTKEAVMQEEEHGSVVYCQHSRMAYCRKAVRDIFLPYFDGAIWFQNASLYHFSMFHASHHLTSVKATDAGIEAEAAAVKEVARSLCPLKIFLDRVVLTSTGVLLGCWQVISGPDPLTIRSKLQNALHHSPEKQLYDPVILHTSFARILGHPKVPSEDMKNSSDLLEFFHELVERVNNKIRGFEATVSELWYVEEYDVLALALDGRIKVRKFPLGCSSH